MTSWTKIEDWDGTGKADVEALTWNGVEKHLGWWPAQHSGVTGWWHLDSDKGDAIDPPVTHLILYDEPPLAVDPNPETPGEALLRLARAADALRP